MVNLQYNDWEKEVQGSEKPVIVEFWHPTCPICKKIESTIMELPIKIGDRAKVIRLNVMDNKENRRLAIEKGVVGTPTIKVYCKGVDVGEIVGMDTLSNLYIAVEDILKSCN